MISLKANVLVGKARAATSRDLRRARVTPRAPTSAIYGAHASCCDLVREARASIARMPALESNATTTSGASASACDLRREACASTARVGIAIFVGRREHDPYHRPG